MSKYIITVFGEVDGGKFAMLVTADRAGCAQVDLEHDCAGFCKLHVARSERRKGIATGLFMEAVNIARDCGKVCMSFTCQKNNAPALAFYKQMGCKIAYDYGKEYMLVKYLD